MVYDINVLTWLMSDSWGSDWCAAGTVVAKVSRASMTTEDSKCKFVNIWVRTNKTLALRTLCLIFCFKSPNIQRSQCKKYLHALGFRVESWSQILNPKMKYNWCWKPMTSLHDPLDLDFSLSSSEALFLWNTGQIRPVRNIIWFRPSRRFWGAQSRQWLHAFGP